MGTNESPQRVGAPDGLGGPAQQCSDWPSNLPTDALQKLVRQLDATLKAAVSEIPGAEFDDLLCAAATARTTLRRRLARIRIREARQALRDSGWTP